MSAHVIHSRCRSRLAGKARDCAIANNEHVLALIISAHSPWNLIVFDLTLSRCIWHSIVRMKYYWRLWRHIAIVRCLHSSHVFANLVWSLVASLYVRPSCHCQRSTFVTWFWKSCLKLCSLLVCSSFMSCQGLCHSTMAADSLFKRQTCNIYGTVKTSSWRNTNQPVSTVL